jgi:hypothetical protein
MEYVYREPGELTLAALASFSTPELYQDNEGNYLRRVSNSNKYEILYSVQNAKNQAQRIAFETLVLGGPRPIAKRENNMIGEETCHLCGARKTEVRTRSTFKKNDTNSVASKFLSCAYYKCGTKVTKQRTGCKDKVWVEQGLHCMTGGPDVCMC